MTENFTDGPLYKMLIQVLPIFVRDPFSATPSLNVQELRDAVGKSHEAVYKWLRKSRLTPDNAKHLVNLANRPENLQVLANMRRTPPTIRDFDKFVYGV